MNAVIIVAGGIGKRMGGSLPKQFLLLQGLPIIHRSILPFVDFDEKIKVIVVVPKEHISTWKSVCKKYNFHVEHDVVIGGETRYQSVKNGLQAVRDAEWVAVHDSVRPFISKKFVKDCFDFAIKKGNAVPCIGVNETVREVLSDRSKPLNRNTIKLIQTPQVFKAKTLKKAYELPFSNNFTDDASVVESFGEKIYLTEGLKQNIKITTSEDLLWAEWKCQTGNKV